MVLKKEKVLIGEREFFIKELTCLKRNSLLDILGSFTFADIVKSVLPLLNDLGVDLKEGDSNDNMLKLIDLSLKDSNIWGGLMACVVTILNIGPQVICLSIEDLNEEDQDYIYNNLTVSQEPVILSKIIDLNDIGQIIKNYKSLLSKVKSLRI